MHHHYIIQNKTTTDDLSVANTIKQQIGGRALFMLGAIHFVGDSDSLRFKIRGSRIATHITIRLEPSDTYTMIFDKVRGVEIKKVAVHEGVYFDGMNQIIESVTGLRCSL
jgi:hypothetical protein